MLQQASKSGARGCTFRKVRSFVCGIKAPLLRCSFNLQNPPKKINTTTLCIIVVLNYCCRTWWPYFIGEITPHAHTIKSGRNYTITRSAAVSWSRGRQTVMLFHCLVNFDALLAPNGATATDAPNPVIWRKITWDKWRKLHKMHTMFRGWTPLSRAHLWSECFVI